MRWGLSIPSYASGDDDGPVTDGPEAVIPGEPIRKPLPGTTPVLLGRYHRTRSGQDVVALIPGKVIHMLGNPSITTTRDLGLLLEDIVVRVGDRLTTPVRFGNRTIRCILIRRDAWEDA